MLNRSLGAGLLLASFVLFPGWVAAQKKPTTPPVDAENLGPGDFTGTVLSIPGSDRTFRLRITIPKIVLNPWAARSTNPQVRHIVRLQNQINKLTTQVARSKNPSNGQLLKIQQLTAQMQIDALRVQSNSYRTTTTTQDVDFQAAEDVKVRKLNLPPKYDDKGNLSKYTAEELKEFKGKDKNLTGYESSLPELAVGQVVTVTLAAHKPASTDSSSSPKPEDKEKEKEANKDLDKDKDKDKAADKDKLMDGEKKLQARTIVIVKDDLATAADLKPNKNK
jgi:hypothetical protein